MGRYDRTDKETSREHPSKETLTRNYRARVAQHCIKRSEVMAPETDRNLIRTLERQLAADGPKAEHVRATAKALIADAPPMPDGILAAPRRSPLVGADIDLSRPRIEGRRIDI